MVLRLLHLLLFLCTPVTGFEVGQVPKHHLSRRAKSSRTVLHIQPIDTQISITVHNMWIATIDSDIANIQLEEFRKVFAGGIAVMVGGLISTTLLGTVIEKRDLYANLAAESYIDMADDPNFWNQMTEGMTPEEQEKAKKLLAKIKSQRAGDTVRQPLTMPSGVIRASNFIETELSPSTSPSESAKNETAKASNDMFSDY